MRPLLAIVRATAVEMMSEPLSLLILIGAMSVSTFAPAFHYHQFGEATRMARDAGLSALLVAGVLFAAFGTLRSYRREIESGTASVALAMSVSRTGFFLAKALGAFVALLFFALVVFANSLTVTVGARIGGEVAEAAGSIARLWRPSYALAVATIAAPVVVAAALNRFGRFRFCLSAFVTTAVFAFGSVGYRFDPSLTARLAPVWAAEALVPVVILAATAAFAIRFRANVAAWSVAGVGAAAVPFVGNHCLSDALSDGGVVGWGYVGLAVLAVMPAVAALLLLGVTFFSRRDLS